MLQSSIGYKPIFRVMKGGYDLTSKLQDRLLEVHYSGFSNSEISRIDFVFDDRDFVLDLPQANEMISFALGYENWGLVDFGQFSIHEVGFSGPPRTMSVSAFGVPLNSIMKVPKITTFGQMSAQQIFEQVGAQAGINVKVSSQLGNVKIPFLNQTGQSGFSLIDTLARRVGGTAVYQNQTVSIIKRGSGESASGQQLSAVSITLADIANYEVKINTRTDFEGSNASYFDPQTLERVIVNSAANIEKTSFAGGLGGGGQFIIGGMHTSQEEAQKAGEAKNDTFGRMQGRLSLTLAKGDPSIGTQQPIYISGVRAGVNGKWIVENVKHSYSAKTGISTTIEGHFASNSDSAGGGGSDGGGSSDGGGGDSSGSGGDAGSSGSDSLDSVPDNQVDYSSGSGSGGDGTISV